MQNSPPVHNAEIFATQSTVRMPIRVWTGDSSPAPAPEAKLHRLVVVRGRVQTKASVESGDSIRDTDALVPVNVSEQAVFVERTQTVCRNSLFPLRFFGKLLATIMLLLEQGQHCLDTAYKCFSQ